MIQKSHHSNTLPHVASCNNWVAFVFDGGIFMDKPRLIEDLGMIKPKATSNYVKHYAKYQCPFCENTFITTLRRVKNGETNSCGCYRTKRVIEKCTTHGMSKTRIYRIWTDMIYRCTRKNNTSYRNYGERGISVCSEWKNNFDAFFEWAVSHGYSEILMIDRINTDGDYDPNNCKWSNKIDQMQNTRLIHSNNKSGYRGVSWHKQHNKWYASICVNGEIIFLGLFESKEMAAKAYNTFIIKNNTLHPLNIMPK